MPRKNALVRPNVSNVDQAVVLFAAASPAPNFNLLDRFLIMMERQQVPTIICFNKKDLVSEQLMQDYASIYKPCHYQVTFTSIEFDPQVEDILELLRGKTTVLAGPSGVGKSSLMNRLQPNVAMETGKISEKIQRGKHTTRHSELIYVTEDTYVMDTPGFSSLYIDAADETQLKNFFVEFEDYEPECKFIGCNHVNEPVCGVKSAVVRGDIHPTRYENYLEMYQELKEKKRY